MNIPLMPMAALAAAEMDVLTSMLKDFSKVQKTAKDAESEHRASWLAGGKLLAALDARLAKAKADHVVRQSFTLEEYFKAMTGSKLPPAPRATACANVYLSLVSTGRLAETDYDLSTSDVMDVVSSIVNLCLETPDSLLHEQIGKTCELVQQFAKTSDKKLRGVIVRTLKNVRDLLKPAKEPDPEQMLEKLREILPHIHPKVLMAEITAMATYACPEHAKHVVQGSMALYETIEAEPKFAGYLNGWIEEFDAMKTQKAAATAPIQVLAAGQPAAQAA